MLALNEEIHFTESRKLAEEDLFWASKGGMAALMAIAAMLALVFSRGETDAKLNKQAKPMLVTESFGAHTCAINS